MGLEMNLTNMYKAAPASVPAKKIANMDAKRSVRAMTR